MDEIEKETKENKKHIRALEGETVEIRKDLESLFRQNEEFRKEVEELSEKVAELYVLKRQMAVSMYLASTILYLEHDQTICSA